MNKEMGVKKEVTLYQTVVLFQSNTVYPINVNAAIMQTTTRGCLSLSFVNKFRE